jgi:tRNA C32,U32 (ribose-2'-O)-methylase TrmJ
VGEHIGRERRAADAARRRSYIEQYMGHIAQALQDITGDSAENRNQIEKNLQSMLERSRS